MTTNGVRPKAAVSWSGGKDSYLAMHRSSETFDVQALLTMFTEDGTRSRSHGLRPEVLARQAQLLNLPLVAGHGSWATYEDGFKRALKRLPEVGISHVLFGDILVDDHKDWVQRVCSECGLEAVEPLWGESTVSLFAEFLRTGAEARIVSANAGRLGSEWLGQQLGRSMLGNFERLRVDPCGEFGEYHTVVVDAPRMSSRLELREAGRLMHDGYWLLDFVVA